MGGLIVMISGKGSLLQAMLNAELPVTAVIADRDCPGLDIARQAGVPVCVFARNFYASFDRVEYTKAIENELLRRSPDLVAMAGFKTILDKSLFKRFPVKILNIHPSLLPAFPGNNAVRDALAYGVKISGCTIHLATAEVDCGLIIAQEPIPVFSSDTVESLHERINKVEQKLYPLLLKKLLG